MATHLDRLSGGADERLRSQPISPVKLALRAALALGLVAALLYYFEFDEIVARLTSVKTDFVLLALGILAAQFFLSCIRWHYVLKRHRLPFSFHRAYAIYGIGALANIVLLNAIAGLSIRGILLVRDGASASRAIGALLIERIAAISGLGLCFVAGFIISYPLLLDHLVKAERVDILLALVVGGIVALGALGAMLWRFRVVRHFVRQIRQSFLSMKVLAALSVASAGIVFLGFASVAALAWGMEIQVDPLFFIAVMPVVAFIAALPISIGGWGVREGVMVAGLALFQVPAEAAIALSIIYGLAGVLLSCFLGGIALAIYLIEQRVRLRRAGGENGSDEA